MDNEINIILVNKIIELTRNNSIPWKLVDGVPTANYKGLILERKFFCEMPQLRIDGYATMLGTKELYTLIQLKISEQQKIARENLDKKIFEVFELGEGANG